MKSIHQDNCQCFVCKYRRGEKVAHKLNCQCASCKSKRGEYSGKNSPTYGRKFSHAEKTKLKISKSHPGKIFSKNHKNQIRISKMGKLNPSYGKTLEECGHEIKSCNCYVCKAKRGECSGENHPAYGKRGKECSNWQGGISFLPYPPEFNEALRESIRERDGRICQMPGCGKTEKQNGRKLDVHHIDYDKDNFSEYNLISLCHSCHMGTNINRKYWKKSLGKI